MGGAPSSRRPVAGSVAELLRDASHREPMVAGDSKSGARFERVTIGGEPFVLKHLSRADDWIMRATGDLAYRPVVVWEAGLLDLAPDCVDHAYVGAARDRSGGGAAILMHDVGAWMVPEGDGPLPLPVHLGFMTAMARFHAATWAVHEPVALMPLANRYTEFAPCVVECERALGFPEAVPRIMGEGWARLASVAPAAAGVVEPLLGDPSPLVTALAATPNVFCHGDWKMGNLGHRPDGRTVLVDWANPGIGPPLQELVWYLALNRARLPEGHTKDDAIAAYRSALEAEGVDTEPWWSTQLHLCLLGGMVQFGWEKALGDADELAWWEERAVAGAGRLGTVA